MTGWPAQEVPSTPAITAQAFSVPYPTLLEDLDAPESSLSAADQLLTWLDRRNEERA